MELFWRLSLVMRLRLRLFSLAVPSFQSSAFFFFFFWKRKTQLNSSFDRSVRTVESSRVEPGRKTIKIKCCCLKYGNKTPVTIIICKVEHTEGTCHYSWVWYVSASRLLAKLRLLVSTQRDKQGSHGDVSEGERPHAAHWLTFFSFSGLRAPRSKDLFFFFLSKS